MTRSKRTFTEEENQFIKNNYGKMSMKQLSLHFKEPVSTIRSRLVDLGVQILPKGRRSTKVKSAGENVFFKEYDVTNYETDE